MNRIVRFCSTSLFALTALPILAQDETLPSADPTLQSPGQRSPGEDALQTPSDIGKSENNAMNQQLAHWALIDQQNIVELARVGVEQAQRPAVREFAELVHSHHLQLAQRLSAIVDSAQQPTVERSTIRSPSVVADPVAPDLLATSETRVERRQTTTTQPLVPKSARNASPTDTGLTTPSTTTPGPAPANAIARADEVLQQNAEITETTETTVRDVDVIPSDRARRDSAAATSRVTTIPTDRYVSPWIRIHEKISEETAEEAREGLRQRQDNFDDAFVGLLATMHLEQKVALEVLSEHSSGELTQLLKQAEAIVADHLMKGRSLMQRIEK